MRRSVRLKPRPGNHSVLADNPRCRTWTKHDLRVCLHVWMKWNKSSGNTRRRWIPAGRAKLARMHPDGRVVGPGLRLRKQVRWRQRRRPISVQQTW